MGKLNDQASDNSSKGSGVIIKAAPILLWVTWRQPVTCLSTWLAEISRLVERSTNAWLHASLNYKPAQSATALLALSELGKINSPSSSLPG